MAPILTVRCAMCHCGPDAALGLRLDSLDNLLKAGRKGPVVKLGDPAGSELIRRIKGTRVDSQLRPDRPQDCAVLTAEIRCKEARKERVSGTFAAFRPPRTQRPGRSNAVMCEQRTG